MASLVKPSLKAEAIHSENVWTVAWANDNIVTGSLDGTVKLWKREDTISLEATSLSQKFGVTSVASVQDGSTILSSYQNGVIRFFKREDMKETALIETGLLESWTICLSPNDEVLASGTQRGSINIWSMQDNHEKVATLETNNGFILASTFSIDAKLASSGMDGLVNVFDVSTQKIVHKIEAHSLPIRSISFSPDGRLLYTASDDRHVSVYDTISGTIVNSFSHKGMAFSVDTAPDGRHFVVGCADSTVSLWDLGMQRKIQTFEQHNNIVWSVSYNKSNNNMNNSSGINKQVFASVGDDALLQLYE